MCTTAGPPRIHSGAAAPGMDEYNMTPALHFGRSGVHGTPTWGRSCWGTARGGHRRHGRGHLQPHRQARANTVSAGVRVRAQTESQTGHIVLPDDIPGSKSPLAQVLSTSARALTLHVSTNIAYGGFDGTDSHDSISSITSAGLQAGFPDEHACCRCTAML